MCETQRLLGTTETALLPAADVMQSLQGEGIESLRKALNIAEEPLAVTDKKQLSREVSRRVQGELLRKVTEAHSYSDFETAAEALLASLMSELPVQVRSQLTQVLSEQPETGNLISDREIHKRALELEIVRHTTERVARAVADTLNEVARQPAPKAALPARKAKELVELTSDSIKSALQSTRGNRSAAARSLGTTVYRLNKGIKEFGIDTDKQK